MESQALHLAVRRIRDAVTPLPAPDAELLRAFARNRDASAFEQIVRRHGPMVLGVCRRVLRDSADADDAFQATFLVLVRKAGSLRAPDRLAGWLHQVASRTARKLRDLRVKRARLEGELFDVPAGESPAEIVWRELRPIFDAELDRLPDRLRLPAVLCLLEGNSKSKAAQLLGWPEGTLSGRLQRARERLRIRLAARGLTLSSGAFAAAWFEGSGTAFVPDRLIATTLQGAWNPAAAAGARALADGVTQAMFLTKVKAVAAAILVAGVVGGGAGVVLVPGQRPNTVVANEPQKEAPAKGVTPTPVDLRELQKELDIARTIAVNADLVIKNLAQRADAARQERRKALQDQVKAVKALMDAEALASKGGPLPAGRAAELTKTLATAEAALKELEVSPARDPDRDILKELDLLKERLDWEERMVKKGFLSESQVKKTRLEVEKAEAALTEAAVKADHVAKARKAMEETVAKLEAIVDQTRRGVERGVVPLSELLNAEATLARYKFDLAAIDVRPAEPGRMTPARRAAMAAVLRKLEEIAAAAEDGFKKGIVAQQELLNAQLKILEFKARLAELDEAPLAVGGPNVKKWTDRVASKEAELTRGEALLKQNVISPEEVRRLRIDLARLKAEAATASGDYAAAVVHWNSVVDAYYDLSNGIRRTAPRAELRTVDVALAEARVEALMAAARQQLAKIVSVREEELQEVRALHETKAVSAEAVRRAEQALAEARARLAAGP